MNTQEKKVDEMSKRSEPLNANKGSKLLLLLLCITILIFNAGFNMGKKAVEPEKAATQSDPVIGVSIKLYNLEIAQHDFPKKMNWNDAMAACSKLGAGWHLPTRDELGLLYYYKTKIGGFVEGTYWSSSAYGKNGIINDGMWEQQFDDGLNYFDSKETEHYVRAVRAYEPMHDPTKMDPVIGKSINLYNLEIAQHDFPNKMKWEEAKAACGALGDGWHLPTKAELSILYNNRKQLGGFVDSTYWSSTESNGAVYEQQFDNGGQYTDDRNRDFHVRAVRAYEPKHDPNKMDPVIGASHKLGNLEIAQYDFPNKLRWEEAKTACTALGNGWRLPTKEELNILYNKKTNLSNFVEDDYYWSSTESDENGVWEQNFKSGIQYTDGKDSEHYVRAVRSF